MHFSKKSIIWCTRGSRVKTPEARVFENLCVKCNFGVCKVTFNSKLQKKRGSSCPPPPTKLLVEQVIHCSPNNFVEGSCSPCPTHVPVLTSTGLWMRRWFRNVSVVVLLTAVTISSSCVMSTLNTNSTAASVRLDVQLFVEPTAACVAVTLASYITHAIT